MDRRAFLTTLGATGATLCAGGAQAAGKRPAEEPYGVLVDTTRCIGCGTCEYVCAEAHGLPEPDTEDKHKQLSETRLTVNRSYETSKGQVNVKRQCMHCVQPACASACLTQAMHKDASGPVVWRSSKCMGCRFCMVSCPFDVPKFEYHSAVPRIVKCDLCATRLKDGQQPACVENCPAEALAFGKRSDLLETAKRRIAENPDRYVPHIYGESEAGGTSYLYLASVPFEELGFNTDVGDTPYPMLTTGFLYGVPFVLTLMPALLLALSNATRRRSETPIPVEVTP